MGNRPAGATVGDAPSSADAGSNSENPITVKLVNLTGLTLHRESVEPSSHELEQAFPKSLSSTASICLPDISDLPGGKLGMLAIYKADVSFGKTSRQEEDIMGKKNKKSVKVASKVDCRDSTTSQFLSLFVTASWSWTGYYNGPLAAAAFGGVPQDWSSLQSAAAGRGEAGCCTWRIEQSTVSVELKKTDSNVVRGRQALLDKLESRSQDVPAPKAAQRQTAKLVRPSTGAEAVHKTGGKAAASDDAAGVDVAASQAIVRESPEISTEDVTAACLPAETFETSADAEAQSEAPSANSTEAQAATPAVCTETLPSASQQTATVEIEPASDTTAAAATETTAAAAATAAETAPVIDNTAAAAAAAAAEAAAAAAAAAAPTSCIETVPSASQQTADAEIATATDTSAPAAVATPASCTDASPSASEQRADIETEQCPSASEQSIETAPAIDTVVAATAAPASSPETLPSVSQQVAAVEAALETPAAANADTAPQAPTQAAAKKEPDAFSLATVARAWPAAQVAVFKRLLQNVVEAPEETKYRRLPLGNPRVMTLLRMAPGSLEALQRLGWQRSMDQASEVEVLELAPSASVAPLVAVLQILEEGVTRPSTRSGTLALQNRAALEQQRREQQEALERQRREEEERKEFEATYSHIVAAQDLEFQQCLLHDQLKDLHKEQGELDSQLKQLRAEQEAAEQRKHNAELRLERYGENPRIRAEADSAQEALNTVCGQLKEVEPRLEAVTTEALEKQELLTIASFATSPH